jgi:hypothetical protein
MDLDHHSQALQFSIGLTSELDHPMGLTSGSGRRVSGKRIGSVEASELGGKM